MYPANHLIRRGFSLLEVLITVVIMGISGALIVPHLADRGGLEVQAAVQQLVSDVSWAQCDAVASQQYRRLHFYADGRGWCLIDVTDSSFADPFDEATAQYSDDPWKTRRGGGDFIVDFVADERFTEVAVSAVSVASGGRDVTFDRLGGTVSAPGLGAGAVSIELSDGDVIWRVNLAPVTGRMSVEKVS
ncbi:MAG: type II secretion system GspH family protein [Phycisphaerales bacterium]|nr:type II secretion system GspH family protein [Phycisphaerales bacterium]